MQPKRLLEQSSGRKLFFATGNPKDVCGFAETFRVGVGVSIYLVSPQSISQTKLEVAGTVRLCTAALVGGAVGGV